MAIQAHEHINTSPDTICTHPLVLQHLSLFTDKINRGRKDKNGKLKKRINQEDQRIKEATK